MIVEISGMVGFLFSKIVPLRKLNVDIVISATGTNPFKCGLIGLPTDEQMIAPFGQGHHIIAQPLECRSCYSNNRPITCTTRHCLTDIAVATVLLQVIADFHSSR